MPYIHVKVSAGEKKETFKKLKADHFVVSVKEPALRNLANRRVLELVEKHFGVLKGKARLISGHRSPSKIVRIEID